MNINFQSLVLIVVLFLTSQLSAAVPNQLDHSKVPPDISGTPDDKVTPVPAASPSGIFLQRRAGRQLLLSSGLRGPEDLIGTTKISSTASSPLPTGNHAPAISTMALPTTPEYGTATPVEMTVNPDYALEPTTGSLVSGGLYYRTTAYIHVDRTIDPFYQELTSYVDRIRVWHQQEGSTAWNYQLGMPTGYTNSVDPVIGANTTSAGVAPGRLYLAGLAMNRGGSTQSFQATNPSSIRVWVSDNQGSYFSSNGSEVDLIQAGTTTTLDKPWLTVSSESSTLGYVYVAWTVADISGQEPNNSQIRFRRSRNGVSARSRLVCHPSGSPCENVATWDAPVTVAAGEVQAAQIVVDGQGYVYVIWMRYNGGQRRVEMVRSLQPGASPTSSGIVFGATQILATTELAPFNITIASSSGAIRAVPCAAATYNAVLNRVQVAWHERETVGVNPAVTNIRYLTCTPTANPSCTTASLPGGVAGVSEWAPAVDTDEAGNLLLSYYRLPPTAGNWTLNAAFIGSSSASLTISGLGGCSQSEPRVGEYHGLRRVPHPNGNRFEVAYVCGTVSQDSRTIQQQWVK